MPMAKAQDAGAAPKEICQSVSKENTTATSLVYAYQIGQRVQLCTHLTALLSPSSHHAIEEVEEQAEGHEAERHPEVGRVGGVDAVAHGGGDRHEAAEAVHEGNEVGEVVGADEGEVAGVGRAEESDLLVFGCSRR